MRIHTHIHKNSPTITPPSLLYFLFPSCFSMLSLSLEKLVTCGVIRSYNLGVQTCRLPALTPSGCLFGSPNPAGQGTKTPSIPLSWRSNLPCASPQTLQTISKPKHRGQLEPKLLTTFRPILFPTEGRVAMGQVKSQFYLNF